MTKKNTIFFLLLLMGRDRRLVGEMNWEEERRRKKKWKKGSDWENWRRGDLGVKEG